MLHTLTVSVLQDLLPALKAYLENKAKLMLHGNTTAGCAGWTNKACESIIAECSGIAACFDLCNSLQLGNFRWEIHSHLSGNFHKVQKVLISTLYIPKN